MKLITHHKGPYHVSLDTVKEFERAILKDPDVVEDASVGGLIADTSYLAWYAQERIDLRLGIAPKALNLGLVKPRQFFAVLMRANLRKCLPHFTLPGQKSLYIFDAWPQVQHRIARFADVFGVNHIFCSSAQVAQRMQSQVKRTRCHWMPEGIDTHGYRSRPTAGKDIDVLALGRKYDRYHQMIVEPLKAAGLDYRYERQPGEIVFPTREGFVDGLARTKISICVPSSVTHPDRAGDIETMTVRYLQSMASRCLIVGHAPPEMVDLFGYNPVIEIDLENPGGQLLSVLGDFASYQWLVERNQMAVMESHDWCERWSRIKSMLAGQPALQATVRD